MSRIIFAIVIGLVLLLFSYLIIYKDLTINERLLISLVAMVVYLVLSLFPTHSNKPTIVSPLPPLIHKIESNVPSPVMENHKSLPYSITETESRWMGWKTPREPLNTNTWDYQLYPGKYAKIIVSPGYHEHIQAYEPQLSASPYVIKRKMVGGYEMDGGADTNTNTQMLPNTAQMPPSQSISPISPNMKTTGNEDNVNIMDVMNSRDVPNTRIMNKNNTNVNVFLENRLTGVVYSGDLIEITSDNAIIQRQARTSQVLLDTPLPTIRTNLSKLRFENVLDNNELSPIKYGELIHIRHNALVDNKNQTKSIKYGDRLQSHQDGPVYDLFKLINKEKPESRDFVKYGDHFLIACGDQPSDKVFLRVETDKSISCESTIDNGTIFMVSLLKPYQISSGNLCVCIDETIFP